MPTFQEISPDNDLKKMIHSAFDLDLDISGAWGYNAKEATVIHSLDVQLSQLEHRLASLRAYIEMNMTLSPEERYASISLKELSRRQEKYDLITYDVLSYEITAMQESIYERFISEYKEMYGKKEFNMTKHFEERKEKTLSRTIEYWFAISQIL